MNNDHPFILSRANSAHSGLVRRHGREKRFQFYGVASIAISIVFMTLLFVTIISNGYSAFFQTKIKLPVKFDIQLAEGEELTGVNYNKLLKDSLKSYFPDVTSRGELISLYKMFSSGAEYELRDFAMNNPEIIGGKKEIWLTAAADIDMSVKNPGFSDRLNESQKSFLEKLKNDGAVKKFFNWSFFVTVDSREPELAGIGGALVGSILTIITCILIAFPIAVGAAIYLEEFAPENRYSDIIEVGVNNLAAVPSIVYGLLGLAIFLNFFNMPRASSLVGGMTLSLLVLPIIIIATRNALKTVPPSLKNAAIGLGASPMQVIAHHILPYAMPGIMTGTIMAIARAIGETAPLLMIGMVAFVANIPASFLDPASSLTVQIYLWADSPERAFVEKTSASIIILLVMLTFINATAVYLRNKFEYKS